MTGVIISVIAATVAAAQPAVCQGVGWRSSGVSTAAFSHAKKKKRKKKERLGIVQIFAAMQHK